MGHPKGTQFLLVGSNWCTSKQLDGTTTGSCVRGVSLSLLFVLFIEYNHRCTLMASGHAVCAWARFVLVRSSNVLILRSARPFWWWDPTPAKVRDWQFFKHLSTHALALKTPLSAWYELTLTP